MRSFMDMWIRIFDFKGTTTVRQYLLALLFDLILGAVLVNGVFYLLGENIALLVFIGYYLLSFLAIISMTIRRIRDTERSVFNIFWVFVPLIGVIVLLAIVLSKSQRERDRDFDRYHW